MQKSEEDRQSQSSFHDKLASPTPDRSTSDKPADFDDGAAVLHGEKVEYTPAEHGALLRKIDWRIMPLAAWGCALQYVDKTALGAAATYGIRTDLHFPGNGYSWAVSCFYLGYLVGTPIMARLLQRFHAGKTIGISFFLWGCTLLAMCGVKNFAGVVAMRLLLGIFEASLAPGLTLITSSWYKQREQPLRFGMWTVLNGVLPVPFLVIYFGLGHVKTGPLQDWRLIFLIVGLLSCLTGIVLFFFLPDTPANASWLNEREKSIAVARVAESQQGMKNTHFKWYQAREALLDYRVWLIVLQMLFSQFIGAVTSNFIGVIIKGLGFTALKAQLLTAPNFAVQAVTTVLVAVPPTVFLSFRHFKQPLVATASCIALAGNVMLYVAKPVPSTQSLRLAACIMISTSGANYTQILATVSANVAGYTKKQVVTSMTFVAYCIAAFVAPQAFLGSESPTYHTGLGTTMGTLCAFIAIAWISWFCQRAENARRDRLAINDPRYRTGDENEDFMSGLRDETDRENMHFRYSG
ncbi:MFS general substrate transporter [Meredithblackwellia eburnea MCA 4105]